jgi:DNA-binding XRE family transcriptional regulator
MPKKTIPRIEAVEAGEQPFTLHVRWAQGGQSVIDVSGMIQAFRVFAPLRADPQMFAAVAVGEYGTHVAWSDEIDMASSTLWRLAQEQSGATITAEAFRRWRERKAYTLDTAAQALGLSRRTVAYYDRGTRPIPRTVALAVKALDLGL